MLYYGDTTIPADTSENEPFEYTIKLTKGVVKQIKVFFPYGCAGLVGVQIIRYTWQLLPQSRTKWLIGDNLEWVDEPYADLNSEPYELIVRAYNLDDTYDHTPLIAIEMVKSTETEGVQKFLKALGIK